MEKLCAHKVGLVLGGIAAICHAVWAGMVFIGFAKPYLDWILGMHFLSFEYTVNEFVFINALMLVIATGVVGYIIGCVFGWFWNFVHRAPHCK